MWRLLPDGYEKYVQGRALISGGGKQQERKCLELNHGWFLLPNQE